eukprot:scaffold325822_cov57-Tisochrysis_lutea.AAC.2
MAAHLLWQRSLLKGLGIDRCVRFVIQGRAHHLETSEALMRLQRRVHVSVSAQAAVRGAPVRKRIAHLLGVEVALCDHKGGERRCITRRLGE